MANDMLVALARATQEGHTFFAHNANRPRGEGVSLVHVPGREFVPGEEVHATHLAVPQTRRTWTVLAGRAGLQWGYEHGVNEKGVAVGYTPIHTRLESDRPTLTGPDLVRLALERSSSARQAIDTLTDLIGRYGQGAHAGQGVDSALLVADAQEAFVLEAAGRHWVLALVGSVRAVTGACLLRQDWDRISRGLSELACERKWCLEDGCKLDFAVTVGQPGPDHARCMRRWGRATLRLEQESGLLDGGLLREVLCDLAEAACPLDWVGERETAASLLVRLGPAPGDLPIVWCAFGSPGVSIYLPVLPVPDLPAALQADQSPGCPLWRLLTRWRQESGDPQRLPILRAALGELQQRIDEHLNEFLPEAIQLHRRGQHDDLRRLGGSFMQYCVERVEEMDGMLHGRAAVHESHTQVGPHRSGTAERDREKEERAVEEMVGAAF